MRANQLVNQEPLSNAGQFNMIHPNSGTYSSHKLHLPTMPQLPMQELPTYPPEKEGNSSHGIKLQFQPTKDTFGMYVQQNISGVEIIPSLPQPQEETSIDSLMQKAYECKRKLEMLEQKRRGLELYEHIWKKYEAGLVHDMGSAHKMMPQTSSFLGEPRIKTSMKKGLAHEMGSSAHQIVSQTSSLFGKPSINVSMEEGLAYEMGPTHQRMPRTSSLFGKPNINASMDEGLAHKMGSIHQMMPRTSILFGEPNINASMEGLAHETDSVHQLMHQSPSLFGEPSINASKEECLAHKMGSMHQMMPWTSSLFGEPSINASKEEGSTHKMGSIHQMMPWTPSSFGEPAINPSKKENQMPLMGQNATRQRGKRATPAFPTEESKSSGKK